MILGSLNILIKKGAHKPPFSRIESLETIQSDSKRPSSAIILSAESGNRIEVRPEGNLRE